ncbi:MAG: DUF3078 domain-containing protein [Bacteroidales bacterium]|nr:DUF3078 domain-containing protein [Bacteroidales bacterium]MCF8343122.1 DUF3078 domain-containing protein [Bacteroidales bacterium]MCF8351260.1 DUF3078 domain-containing protein [Bacteroidales bacterium]MCF8376090.1 DUF3078 domain-containing protein [Bacteroidales bacterium]MCF8400377.1 DUF3078 domain-containing protein [Bacteroidales bacterium]
MEKRHLVRKRITLFFLWIVLMGASIASHASNNSDTTSASAVVDSIKYWKFAGQTALHFNQMSLNNWSSGGESSLAGKGSAKVHLSYDKDNVNFDSKLNMMFGLIGLEESGLQKTDDKIDFSSNYSLKAFKDWSYSTFLNLKTQFAEGYKYPNDSTVISDFFAPGYIKLSLGMKYKPSDELLILLSPASGKFTFVCNQELANIGSFGVKPAVVDDSTGMILEEGKNYKAEFGINVVFSIEKEVVKNITAESKLNLYNNYLDDNLPNRWNIDLDWESNITFAVNKHIETDLYIHMIYDHETKISQYEMVDGEKVKVGEGPRLQFKESFGLGLAFKF